MNYRELKQQYLQSGEIPSWYSTNALQFFMEKYSYKAESPLSREKSIAKALAENAGDAYPEWWTIDPYTAGKTKEQVFFNVVWDGFAVHSTPLKSNGGVPERGTTVSCSGQSLQNNIFSRYDTLTELAVFTKLSHGTSISIDDWVGEGFDLGDGNYSEGVMPIVNDLIRVTDQVVQGTRRGSVGYYIGIDHADFYKVAENLYKHPDSNNVGWIVRDSFIERLAAGDEDAIARWEYMLYVRLSKGRGYLCFIDRMNRSKAQVFKDRNLTVKASNLCCEVLLPANEDYSFTCVIMNLNLARYRDWPEHLVQIVHMMQDANVTMYLKTIEGMKSHNKKAMQKAYKFTKEFRAVGTGVCGWHSLLMQEGVVVGSIPSFTLNAKVFRHIRNEAEKCNSWLASVYGEPGGLIGYGKRNATNLMLAPTKSSTELAYGSPTEGIGYETALIKVKESAGGEIFRINTALLNLLKQKGLYNDHVVSTIATRKGTIAGLDDWFTKEEQEVFRIAFEIPMEAVLNLASQRQQWIDQQQSINLYFSGSDSEEYVAKIHRMAAEDEGINSLYYCYSSRGGAYERIVDCESCQ